MFSNSTKYAIRTIEYLLNHHGDEKLSVANLAKELDIPQPFLSKIMQQLSKGGVISSTKGRGGGFYLSKENMNRPLIDVVICIEGYNVFDKCILGLKECSDENPCLLHKYYKVFKGSLVKPIGQDSIEELLRTPSG